MPQLPLSCIFFVVREIDAREPVDLSVSPVSTSVGPIQTNIN